MTMEWVYVRTFESESRPGTRYEVSVERSTRVLGCNCKRWTFKRPGQPRSCKHTKAVTVGEAKLALGLTSTLGRVVQPVRIITMNVVPDEADIKASETFWADGPRVLQLGKPKRGSRQ